MDNATVPRLYDGRAPAHPRTRSQHERCRRIVHAAAVLGIRRGLEHVQMSDVAARAEVAVGTLYRYYPSKHHLFAAVLADQIDRFRVSTPVAETPAKAVSELMTGVVRDMLAVPKLARAMLVSINVLRTQGLTGPSMPLDRVILETAALERQTEQDRRLARIVAQCAYGILTWATAGEISHQEAIDDMRRACTLLLAPWSNRVRAGG